MKRKLLLPFLFVATIFFSSCEKEATQENSTLTNDDLAFVSEEILDDLNFADLLNEGDDGTFWGDVNFAESRSAEIEQQTCPARTVTWEPNKTTVTLDFSGEDCDRSGTIIIEYLKPNDNETERKKTISYINFTKNDVTYNGTKEITRRPANDNIHAEIEIDKLNQDGVPIHVARTYTRQIQWICGIETRNILDDNIKTITGSTEIVRTLGDTETTYSRQITSPLLLVKACDMHIQAGTVEIERPNGTKITIDYGQADLNIDCDTEFDCHNTIVITKGEKTYTVELINGERVQLKD